MMLGPYQLVAGRIAFTFVVAFLLTSHAEAQPFETLAGYRLHYHLPSSYDKSESPPGEKFRLLQQTVDITAPLPIATPRGDMIVVAGMFYNHYRFDATGGSENVPTEQFNRMTFKAGVSYPWNARHRTTLIFLPTWAQQGSVFEPEAFQAGLLALHSIRFSDRFTLKFGLYYNREFFGNFFMPLAGVDWRLNNDWYVFGVLPGTANVYKKVNEWFAFSFSERAPNGSLLLSGGNGDFVGIGRGVYALFMFDLHFTPFRFDLMGSNSDLTFSMSFGYSIFRKYALYDVNDMELERGPFYPSRDGPYLKFMASVRVWP